MSQYDGLNLTDLLALMHGLVVPEPVPWMLATPAWSILLGWVLGTALIIAAAVLKRRKRNRYRRVALAELATLKEQFDDNSFETGEQVAAVLKRTALAAFPRDQVASLSGADWARFLIDSSNNDRQIAAVADRLAVAAYQTDSDGKSLIEPARRWIRLHRA